MPKIFNRSALTCAISSALLLLGNSASANDFALEEIVVTAQKRAQSIQEIPMSVSALSEDALKTSGVESVADIQSMVPALNIVSSNSPAQSSISIRGAGTGAADPTLEPSVGVFVDGVFMPRSIFGLSDLVSIDRVEILLGPQGTLYGKNTNAGVISVHTKGMPDSFELDIEQSFGSDSLSDSKLDVGGLITDDLGYRFSARNRRKDGVMEDEFTNAEYNAVDKQSYRGQLFWNASEDLSVRAISYYSLSDSNQSQDEVHIEPGSAYAGYTAAFLGAEAPEADVKDRKVAPTEAAQGRVEVQGASIQFEYDLGDYLLTSITAYQEWEQDNGYVDNDSTRLDISYSNAAFNEESISQEIRISSPGGETIDWIAGGFYFKSDLEGGDPSSVFAGSNHDLNLGGTQLFSPGDQMVWNQTFSSESIALFGQATWNLSEQTAITAGLRYNQEEKEFTAYSDTFDADGTAFRLANLLDGSYTGGFFYPTISGQTTLGDAMHVADDRKDSDVTGMISISHFIDDHMIYASIASGSKSGGFNGSFGAVPVSDREYESENTVNYEIGAKLDLMDGRARVNVAYFYTEYKDFQATTFDPVSVAFGVINAGRQVTQGVDVDASYLATENLTLSVKFEYLDARYKDFTGANCALNSGEFINTDGDCVLDDERMESAPNWSGSVAADYIVAMNEGELYLHGDLSFKTSHISDPTRSAASQDTRYELLNARMGWRNDSWDVSLWGKNLTDDYYASAHTSNLVGNAFDGVDTFLGTGKSSSNSYRRWINEPRSWGMSVQYKL